jgi:hypothetical protein
MALPINADSTTKSLDSRITALEKTIQSTPTTLTFQVGGSKIIISASEIRLETSGKITIRPMGDVSVEVGGNASVRAGMNLTLKASGQGTLQASGTLTLKGAVINQN